MRNKNLLIFGGVILIIILAIVILWTQASVFKKGGFLASILGVDSGEICTSSTKKGDANGDGQVTSGDSQVVFDIYLQKRAMPTDISCIDMNNDGQITPKDANIITNIYLGKCSANGAINLSTNLCDSVNCGSSMQCNGLAAGLNDCTVDCRYAPSTCSDSDNGKNYYIRGTTSGLLEGVNYSLSDSCSNNNLLEYFCEGNKSKSESYTCEFGCADGQCKSCTDSDNGKDYYRRGTCMDREKISLTDSCSSGSNLTEFYCGIGADARCSADNHACENGCKDGACLKIAPSCNNGQIIGDADGDGNITATDVQILSDIVARKLLKPDNICCLDVNGDGEITADDAQLVSDISAGKKISPGKCGDSILTLRQLASKKNMFIGTAVRSSALEDNTNNPLYEQTLKKEFNIVTPELSMQFFKIHPNPPGSANEYDFSSADYLVNFAEANNMQVRGHALIWFANDTLPNWLKANKYTKAELSRILCDHVKTVAGHFKGKIYAWDVVNEPISGQYNPNIWLSTIGPEYIDMAFKCAREADSNAKLFLNEVGADGRSGFSDLYYNLAKSLLDKDVPLDGIGFQMHIITNYELDRFNPSKDDIIWNMQRFAALGLEIHVTELDALLFAPDDPITFSIIKRLYGNVLEACLSVSRCISFATWGFTDKFSSITDQYPHQITMIFGANYNPKSVYYKFKELFRTFIAPARETQSPRQLIKKGDANKDGQITSGDSQIVFDIYLRKRSAPANISYIDMNNDGQITPKDANIITNIYLGKCAADGLTNISNVCDSTNCGSAEGCNKMKPSTGNCDEKCSLIKRNICNDGISYELSSNHVAYDRNSRQETSYIIPGTSIKLGIKNLQTGITDFNSGYTFESDKPSVVKIQGNLGIDNITKYDNYDMLVNVSIPELRNCKNIKQPIKTIIGDPFLQDDIGYIYPKSIIPKNVLNPNQEWATISVEQAMNKFQLPKTAELTYKLQTDLFGVKPINGDAIILALMPSWCGGAGPITGFGVGCLIGPNNEPQWGVIFHEIGHVFTGHFQLEWVDGLGGIYPTNSKIFMTFSDNFGLAFSEATATLASMYTEYYLIKNYSQYGLNQDTFDSLDRHFKTRQGYVNDLRNYEKDGNNFAKIDANILDGIFIEIANDNGINPFGWDLYPRAFKAYLNPLPSFISGPLTGIQSHTYFIASLTAASGSDLRTKFKGYGFPIDDAYFEKILPVLQKKLGSNITAPEKPIITETESPTTSTLLKSESTNKIYEVIDNKKLWIPTVEAFNKVGLEWGDVQNVSEAKANQYSRLKLARIAGDPRVYYLTEGGLKRWIPNEQVFTSYNNKWEDVVEISPTKLNIYPNNILIKLDNETRVYKLENNQKRWIKTAEAFNRLGFDWTKIAPVNQTEFNYYQEGAQIE